MWICNLSPYLYLSTNLSPLSLSLSHYPSLCVCLQKQASTCQTRFHIANVICKLVYTMYFFSPLDQSTPPHNQRIVPRPVSQSVNLSVGHSVTLPLCQLVSSVVVIVCQLYIAVVFVVSDDYSLILTFYSRSLRHVACGMRHVARCSCCNLELLQSLQLCTN